MSRMSVVVDELDTDELDNSPARLLERLSVNVLDVVIMETVC